MPYGRVLMIGLLRRCLSFVTGLPRTMRGGSHWVHPESVASVSVELSLALDPDGLRAPGTLALQRAFAPQRSAGAPAAAAPQAPERPAAPARRPAAVTPAPAEQAPSAAEEPRRKPGQAA